MAAGKQAMAGLFASSIAHDLNNILVVSQYATEMLTNSQAITDSDQKHVERLETVNTQIASYAKRLSDLSGKHISSGIRKINITSAISATLKLASKHIKVKRCSIETELPEEVGIVDIDEALLNRALLNILINASEATNGRGRILVQLTQTDDTVQIAVHDDGPGISSQDRECVFEPFYSTKPDGSGLGLLSIRHCAEVHNGSFKIESSPLGGTCFFMIFPKKHTSQKTGNQMIF